MSLEVARRMLHCLASPLLQAVQTSCLSELLVLPEHQVMKSKCKHKQSVNSEAAWITDDPGHTENGGG